MCSARSWKVHRLLLVAFAVSTASCDKGQLEELFPSSPSGTPTVVSLTLFGPSEMDVGQAGSVGATATFTDGTTALVQDETSFSSSNPSVVAVSGQTGQNGLSARDAGTAIITGTYRGVSGTLTIRVNPPPGSVAEAVAIGMIIEESLNRTFEGLLNPDGTFSGTLTTPVTLPSGAVIGTGSIFTGRIGMSGSVRAVAPAHGGGHLTATETLRFTSGCPGPVVFSYAATSSTAPDPGGTFRGTATKTADNGCGFRDSFGAKVTIAKK